MESTESSDFSMFDSVRERASIRFVNGSLSVSLEGDG